MPRLDADQSTGHSLSLLLNDEPQGVVLSEGESSKIDLANLLWIEARAKYDSGARGRSLLGTQEEGLGQLPLFDEPHDVEFEPPSFLRHGSLSFRKSELYIVDRKTTRIDHSPDDSMSEDVRALGLWGSGGNHFALRRGSSPEKRFSRLHLVRRLLGGPHGDGGRDRYRGTGRGLVVRELPPADHGQSKGAE
ncbi:MAG: hypothetical protein AAF368_08775, partial [Planctomycetota bacterium]